MLIQPKYWCRWKYGTLLCSSPAFAMQETSDPCITECYSQHSSFTPLSAIVAHEATTRAHTPWNVSVKAGAKRINNTHNTTLLFFTAAFTNLATYKWHNFLLSQFCKKEKPNRSSGLKSGHQISLHSLLSGSQQEDPFPYSLILLGDLSPLWLQDHEPTSLMAVSSRLCPASWGQWSTALFLHLQKPKHEAPSLFFHPDPSVFSSVCKGPCEA